MKIKPPKPEHIELIKAWKASARDLWDHIQEAGTAETTLEEKARLRTEYKSTFGPDGSAILNKLITSKKLNGGENPQEDRHFPGMEYSMALGLYFMRRALREYKKDDAYEAFLRDVGDMAKATGKALDKYPSQKFLEDLCKKPLKIVRELTRAESEQKDALTAE